jgi:hypothetical protein
LRADWTIDYHFVRRRSEQLLKFLVDWGKTVFINALAFWPA